MGMVRRELSELDIVVGLAPFGISEGNIGFSESDKLLLGISVVRAVFGMQLNTLLPISSIDFLEAGIPLDAQYFIVVLFSIRIVPFEERLLLLFDTVVLEEPLESLQSLIFGVVVAGQLIIVVAPRLV